MNIDTVLRWLAPLTPAVLPIIVLVWHRTRGELRGLRSEVRALREQRLPLADPRIDELVEIMDGMRAELARLNESQQAGLRLLAERETTVVRIPAATPGTPR